MTGNLANMKAFNKFFGGAKDFLGGGIGDVDARVRGAWHQRGMAERDRKSHWLQKDLHEQLGAPEPQYRRVAEQVQQMRGLEPTPRRIDLTSKALRNAYGPGGDVFRRTSMDDALSDATYQAAGPGGAAYGPLARLAYSMAGDSGKDRAVQGAMYTLMGGTVGVPLTAAGQALIALTQNLQQGQEIEQQRQQPLGMG